MEKIFHTHTLLLLNYWDNRYRPQCHDSKLSFYQPRPLDLFPQGCSQTSYSQCVGITSTTWRTWHLLLLNFIWSLSAQLSSLSRSLCKASLPLGTLTVPPSLVASANALNAHLIPACRSVIKAWKSTGPGMEPWWAPLVTSLVYPH